MITKLSTFSGVADNGEPLVRLFRQGDSVQKVAGHMMPEVQEWLATYKSDKDNIALLINALGSSEYWGQNINGDYFTWEGLIHDCRGHKEPHKYHPLIRKNIPAYGYWTFLNAHPFAHHRNKDPSRAFGNVVVSCLNPRMKRVELVSIINRKKAVEFGAERIVSRIDDGEYPSTSMGCFVAGTLVTMPDGTRKPIEDVKVGDMVLTHLGRARKVTETHVRKYKGDLVVISAEAHEHVRCTSEHPLWAVEDKFVKTENSYRRWLDDPEGSAEWIHSGCLGGHHLLSPVMEEVLTPDYADEAFCRILGYYLAEGHILRNKKKEICGIEFTTHIADAIHDEIEELCKKFGTRNPPSFYKKSNCDKAVSVSIHDPKLASLCHEHGGGYAKKKKLSAEAMRWHPDLQKHIIGAYANGDGHFTKNGALTLSTSSTDLAWQLTVLLPRFGVVPSIQSLTHKAGSGFSTRNTFEWVIFIGKTYVEILEDYCSKIKSPKVLRPQKARKILSWGEDLSYMVTPIRETYAMYVETDVYNLEVEEDESYVAGGLAAHNCRVPFDKCRICGHLSRTRKDYCNCIKTHGMGTILPDGRQVGVINDYPRFFDISFVFIGADPTSRTMCKFAGLWIPESVLAADEVYGLEPMEKAAASESSFTYETQSEGTHRPKKHYIVSGGSKDGSGEVELSRLEPKPEKKVIMDNKAFQQLLDNLDLDKAAERLKKVNLTGLADKENVTTKEVDPGQLAMGIKVEMEHTKDKTVAKQIAMDHLTEIPDYYTRLEKMEDEAKEAMVSSIKKTFTVSGHPDIVDRVEKTLAIADKLGKWGSSRTIKVSVDGDGHERLKVEGARDVMGDVALEKDEIWPDSVKFKEAGIRIGPPPSPNRKEYPYEGTIDFQGLRIYVENKPGSVREGTDPKTGKKWRTKMINAYGEILGTKGTDKDRLDVYVGPNKRAKDVYVVHQNVPATGKYDEDKAMIGFNSPEEAKGAYLKHYDSPKFFRSMTTMPFATFKKVIKGEVKGEKVASLEKVAVDLKLEDLFSSGKLGTAVRRHRSWVNKDTGESTHHVGSGLGTSFDTMDKTAEAGDKLAAIRDKIASQKKWAEIIKEIGPDDVVGKVSPLLREREEDFPKEVLDEIGKLPLQEGLSTPSILGMSLKPREFQRVILINMGRPDIANDLDSRGHVFSPVSGEIAPCHPLGPSSFSTQLMHSLLPFLQERSYLDPIVRKRILRITIVSPKKTGQSEKKSPLLSKVASAYNWYRREMVKAATYAPEVVSHHPEFHSGVFGLQMGDLFKTAGMNVGPVELKNVPNAKALAAIVASVPLALMYSSSLSREDEEDLNFIQKAIADHPWLTAMGSAALMREVMKSPQAQKAVDEVVEAGKRAFNKA